VAGRKTTEQAAAGNDALELHKSQQQHDQILLATYLSVDEIELLRNRRLDVLEGQARVIGQYLEQLKALRRAQEEQMKKFRPYTAGRAAPALPERLAEEIVRTVADGESQQRALSAKQDEIARTRQEFSADIARFRELKGVVRPPGQTTSP
jgi:hypothetical protein